MVYHYISSLQMRQLRYNSYSNLPKITNVVSGKDQALRAQDRQTVNS